MPPYPPYQMNQEQAALYCGVSIQTFRKIYRTKLPYREEDGDIYFLKDHIERLLHKKFKEDALWPADERKPSQALIDKQKQASGISTKLSTDTDAFSAALERRTMRQRKDARSVG